MSDPARTYHLLLYAAEQEALHPILARLPDEQHTMRAIVIE